MVDNEMQVVHVETLLSPRPAMMSILMDFLSRSSFFFPLS